ITINLAPADLKKSGGAFDLAIAAATLGALGKIPAERLTGVALLGELSLTGAVRPVRGVLPALRGAVASGVTRAVVPRDNAREGAARRAGRSAGVRGGVRAGGGGSVGRARAARGAARARDRGRWGAQPHL